MVYMKLFVINYFLLKHFQYVLIIIFTHWYISSQTLFSNPSKKNRYDKNNITNKKYQKKINVVILNIDGRKKRIESYYQWKEVDLTWLFIIIKFIEWVWNKTIKVVKARRLSNSEI